MDRIREVTAAICVIALVALISEEEKNRLKRKRKWIKEWRKNRDEKGSFVFLTKELKLNDDLSCRNYLRMNENCFNEILNFIRDDITKKDTIMRKAISPQEKLALTLRYFATGESLKTLQYQTRLSSMFIGATVIEVATAIYKNMQKFFLKFPESKEEWRRIAQQFAVRWQFPLCLGALDVKHIRFRAAKKDGAKFYNYKGFNNIVLLALSDANFKFIFVDIGANGRISDGGVLSRSDFKTILNQPEKYFPEDTIIGEQRELPYLIVGDDAFPLEAHLMKPYPWKTTDKREQSLNLRLSRARQCVEHSFGMLSNRFRIFQTTIHLNQQKVKTIVKACCVLHNFLICKNQYSHELLNSQDNTERSEDDTQRRNLNKLNQNKRISAKAKEIRNKFADYFYAYKIKI